LILAFIHQKIDVGSACRIRMQRIPIVARPLSSVDHLRRIGRGSGDDVDELGVPMAVRGLLLGDAVYSAIGRIDVQHRLNRRYLGSVYRMRGDCVIIEIKHKIGFPVVLHVTSNCMLGCTESTAGELRSARSHFEQAVGLYAAEQHDTHSLLSGLDLGVFASVHLAHTLCYLGYPDQALKIAQEAMDLARTLLHPFSHISALSYLSMLHQFRGDRRAVQESTATAHRLCVEHDIPYYLAWTTFLQGWAIAEKGHVNQATSQMEQSLADLQAMQAGLRKPYYLGLLAEAYGTAGRIEDGLSLLADAIAIAAEEEQNLYEPDLHRVRGELLWKRNSPHEAIEACFRQAIDVARQQEAKLMELRAATTLAQLLDHQGNDVEARRVLTEVFDWFREGYATADLRKARAFFDVRM